MKHMFRTIASLLCIALTVFAFAACGEKTDTTGQSTSADSDSANSESDGVGAELALMVNPGSGIDDKSFGQGTWEGLKQYAEENNISYQYYVISDNSEPAYLNSIELAVMGGAKVILCPGYSFAGPIGKAQDLYPDTKFVIIDSAPVNENGEEYVKSNTFAVSYSENEAGFLAGYAAVKDGYRKLGFLGGVAEPTVVRFGYGFVQGVEYAAKELNLAPGDTEVTVSYTGNWDANPENQSKAASWYQSGTEIIFACGGALGQSVFAAAEASNAKAIGVDVDQSGDSETVVTSAMKNISVTAYDSVSQFYAGTFPGGKSEVFGVDSGAVGLPMENSRFTAFNADDYKQITEKMSTGELGEELITDTDFASAIEIPTVITRITTLE